MAQFPDRGGPILTPWQRLSPAARTVVISSVVNETNVAFPPSAQRTFGGRIGGCELYTLGLSTKFSEHALRLRFAHSSQLESIFDVDEGSLSGRLGHTFGVLENELLFDLTIEQFYTAEDQQTGNVPPIVHTLMTDGFVALTDENLFAYAEALAKKPLSTETKAGCVQRFLQ